MTVNGLSARCADAGTPTTAVAVVGATLLLALLSALFGTSVTVDAQADNDSLLRLVQIRDLLAGQPWFEHVQSRMGLAGGFEMHWSRLVDAPVGLLILLVGEQAALLLWPSILFGLSLAAIVVASGRLTGLPVAFPALVIGGVTLYATGLFRPGTLDHHNLQLVLTLWLAAALTAPSSSRGHALAAGSLTGFMLAVSAESLPLVAASAGFVVLRYLVLGQAEANRAEAYGVALAGSASAILLATVPISQWGAPVCDAFSSGQALLAAIGGVGLAATAHAGRGLSGRVVLLGLLGIATIAVVLVALPGCLQDPYAGLDPALKRLWLSAIGEAQPVWSVLARAPALFAASYVTPVLALLFLGHRLARRRLPPAAQAVATLLAMAFLVSLWQVRGAIFSVPLAAIVLAVFVAERRAQSERAPGGANGVLMILAWIAAFHVSWNAVGGAAEAMIRQPESLRQTAGTPSLTTGSECYRAEDYAALAGEPASRVLAISNLGSAILAHTRHAVLSGPYHRNIAGNLAALQVLTGSPSEARGGLADLGVALVVHCPGNAETAFLAANVPGSLIGELAAGRPPSWLAPIDASEDATLKVFRVGPP